MAASGPLAQIERALEQLSYDERLWLIERLIHDLRRSSRAPASMDGALAKMAADPEIRNELAQIARDFSAADMDGLEQS